MEAEKAAAAVPLDPAVAENPQVESQQVGRPRRSGAPAKAGIMQHLRVALRQRWTAEMVEPRPARTPAIAMGTAHSTTTVTPVVVPPTAMTATTRYGRVRTTG